MTMRLASALALAALAGAACVPEEGPLMAPGRDCLECHGGGGEEDAKPWTVAGTMGGQGSRIDVTDANGFAFTLHAAQNGNFYTAESVRFPLRVSVDGRAMNQAVSASMASCNRCHGSGGDGGGGD